MADALLARLARRRFLGGFVCGAAVGLASAQLLGGRRRRSRSPPPSELSPAARLKEPLEQLREGKGPSAHAQWPAGVSAAFLSSVHQPRGRGGERTPVTCRGSTAPSSVGVATQ